MVLGVFVRATIEKQSKTKHVESLINRRLDEGSNPSDSTIIKSTFRKEGAFFIQDCFRFVLIMAQYGMRLPRKIMNTPTMNKVTKMRPPFMWFKVSSGLEYLPCKRKKPHMIRAPLMITNIRPPVSRIFFTFRYCVLA